MATPTRRIILVRHGELALKSRRVRARLMRTLTRRIEEALQRAGVEALVGSIHSRHLVHADDLDAAVGAVSKVFGITSLSVCEVTGAELSELASAAAEYARTHFPPAAQSFAMRARRSGNQTYTSQDVARVTGAAVLEAMRGAGRDVKVALGDPDWSFHVEVRDAEAFLHHERHQGPGGLPLGSQGRVVAWLHGTDSAVSAYLIMRRGAQIVPFFLQGGAGGESADAAHVHEVLRAWGAPRRLHEVRVADDLDPASDPVAYARAAMQEGISLAKATGARALVTPETRDIAWADRLVEVHIGGDVPVLRPLMGLDRETIDSYRGHLGLPRGGTGRRPDEEGLIAEKPGGGQ